MRNNWGHQGMNSENSDSQPSVTFDFLAPCRATLSNKFQRVRSHTQSANRHTKATKAAPEIWTGEISIRISLFNKLSVGGFVLLCALPRIGPQTNFPDLSTRTLALTTTQKLVTAFVSGARTLFIHPEQKAGWFYGAKVKVTAHTERPSAAGMRERQKVPSRDQSWPKKRKEWAGARAPHSA